MYIVLEYLIIENFIINFLILYLTKIITRNQGSMKRIAIGAFVASLYSLAYFLPLKELLLSTVGKVIISMLIIRICFVFINIKIFVKTTIAFYVTSFIFAGATIATFFAGVNNYTFNGLDFKLEQFPINLLVIGVFVSFIGSRIIFKYFNLKVTKENYIADVVIHYKGKKVQIKALVDTGNSLKEPITKKKVMVVDYRILKDLLPSEVEKLIVANDKGDYLMLEKQLDLLKSDFFPTMIPYKSIGGQSTIIGFTPDFVEVKFNDNEKICKDIIVGLYSGSLTNEMGYNGLLNFEMKWGDLDEVSKVQS